MDARKRKRDYIYISESDDEGDDEDEDDDEEDEEDEDEDEDEEDDDGESSSRDDDTDWSSEEEGADFDSVEEEEDDALESKISPLNEQGRYNRVIDLLRGRCDLQTLNLEECKTYLRKHGLRITGTKAICIQRIQEHWRIKDGNGEKLYPRSSFTINCTGDVCKGDVVLFTQRVYEKFDKVTRNGNVLGKRIIAGRVVKESYGAAKQQHTFTVEVLWSKGVKKLPPLFPLLVKGRNLYRLKTFRQHWDNEAKRLEVLSEKHRRGTVARHVRAMKKACSANGGARRQRSSHQTRPSPKRRRNEVFPPATKIDTRKNGGGRGKAPVSGKAKVKRAGKQRAPKRSSPRHLQPTSPKENRVPMLHPYTQNGPPNNHYGTQLHLHPRDVSSMVHANRRSFNFSNEVASSSTVMPKLQHQGYGHTNYMRPAYTNYDYQLHPRNLNHVVDQGGSIYGRQFHSVPFRMEMRRADNGILHCSRPGCQNLRTENCVVSSCWRCCRGIRGRCPRHQL